MWRRGEAKWKVSSAPFVIQTIKLYTYLINSHALKQYKGFLLEFFFQNFRMGMSEIIN